MDSRLFRQEALDARESIEYGRLSILQPLAVKWVVALSSAFSVALVLFVIFGEFTRKARVVGYLQPDSGLITVWSPRAGLLQTVFVTEGQTVEKGAPLFVIVDPEASLENVDSLAKVEQQLLARRLSLENELIQEEQLESMQIEGGKRQVKSLHEEKNQLKKEVAIGLSRVELQGTLLGRYHDLRKKNHASEIEVNQMEREYLDFQAQHQSLVRRGITIEQNLAKLASDTQAQKVQMKVKQAVIKRQIAQLTQQITEHQLRQSRVVVAPAAGVVSSLLLKKYQMVKVSQPVLSIFPKGTTMQAVLLVPSDSVGFLHNSQGVVIRYGAFPYQKFGHYEGVVESVAQNAISPGDMNLPVKVNESVYLVMTRLGTQKIKTHNGEYELKSGMRLDADIRLETRKIYEWMLNPVLSYVKKT